MNSRERIPIKQSSQEKLDDARQKVILDDASKNFFDDFAPLLFRIEANRCGGCVRFGENGAYFIDLPAGKEHPYVYQYNNYKSDLAEIWLNVLYAEHGWPTTDELEKALRDEANEQAIATGVPCTINYVRGIHRMRFDQAIVCVSDQLSGLHNRSDPYGVSFQISPFHDPFPLERSNHHFAPYTEDGATYIWALTSYARLHGNQCQQQSARAEAERQVQVGRLKKRLDQLKEEGLIKATVEANNGVLVHFTGSPEWLLFEFNGRGVSDLLHLAEKLRPIISDPDNHNYADVINRAKIREWFTDELVPLANRLGDHAVIIWSDRKYQLIGRGLSAYYKTFTLTNYRRTWRILSNVLNSRRAMTV